MEKKSKEILEQQKSSFLNFVWNKKKYEPIIVELFLMDDEKNGDINYIRDYLKWKWIDSALVDNFEDDYKKYLRGRYFYWPIDQYPQELQSKIIENNKILEKLKKEIVEDYNKIGDLDLLIQDTDLEFGELLDELGGFKSKGDKNFLKKNIPCINSIRDKINKYLNYFFFWENKNIDNIYWYLLVPTIFSAEKIDEDVLNIMNILGDYEYNYKFDGMDYRFLNDLFVHTSDFRTFDEFLREWGLISHSEILNRLNNQNIKESSMDHNVPHKDIYFSRWFNDFWYWYSKSFEDKVFYVNTMDNFALNGYWVPLNLTMQPNLNIENNEYNDDGVGFSIISKSSLDEDNYGKIDVKDVFIFISETKKSIIEQNPERYPIDNAHIIYIPKEYYSDSKYTYKVFEYIEEKMKHFKQNKKIVPYKIIWNNDDRIESYWNDYLWAFCTEVWKNKWENNIVNLLWDWSVNNVINFLKKCSMEEDKPFIDQIEPWMRRIRFENISIPLCLPLELFQLIYAYLKIDYNHRPQILNITKLLSKSWYSQKEIAIFVEILHYWGKTHNFKTFCYDFSVNYDDIVSINEQLWKLL